MYNEKLKELRHACGFSQQTLADKIRKERSAYAYYEIGKSEPSIETLKKLSKIYGVSVDYIIGDDNIESVGKVAQSKVSYRKYGDEKLIVPDLEKDEKNLVITYRLLTDEQKAKLLDYANGCLDENSAKK